MTHSGSQSTQANRNEDVQTNSKSSSTSSYTPDPRVAKMAKEYPEAYKEYQNGASLFSLLVKYPGLAQSYMGLMNLSQDVDSTPEWEQVLAAWDYRNLGPNFNRKEFNNRVLLI
jgi:hypothetical protein